MWGKPWPAAVRARPSMGSSRPRTLRRPRDDWIWLSNREKNEERRKKLPSNVNENGMVGKPAGPTTAPGGSVAGAACVAAAGVDPLDPPAGADPLAPPARVRPPHPPAGADPLDPAAGVDPLDPAAGVDPLDPAAGVDPLDPAAGVDPLDPAAGVDPLDPAAGVDPVDPFPGDGAGVAGAGAAAAPLEAFSSL